MKKLTLIVITVFLNVFLISCTSDDVVEAPDKQDTEAVATGGEDEQTPAGEEDDD